MAPFFLLLLISQILLCAAVDTINSSAPLSGVQQIVSKGNKFTLGFYTPPQGKTTSSSSNYYIAIWYSNIPQKTTVWTANSDAPVTDPTTAALTIGSDGNLVLLDQSKNRQLWSTNMSIGSNSTIAVLQDDGSLDLIDATNSSNVYWRSIDHPTNTWLPGGKAWAEQDHRGQSASCSMEEHSQPISWLVLAGAGPKRLNTVLHPVEGFHNLLDQWPLEWQYFQPCARDDGRLQLQLPIH